MVQELLAAGPAGIEQAVAKLLQQQCEPQESPTADLAGVLTTLAGCVLHRLEQEGQPITQSRVTRIFAHRSSASHHD